MKRAKSKIGKANKFFIKNVNRKVRELLSVDQWQDSDEVISWLKNITNKSKCMFMQSDIK